MGWSLPRADSCIRRPHGAQGIYVSPFPSVLWEVGLHIFSNAPCARIRALGRRRRYLPSWNLLHYQRNMGLSVLCLLSLILPGAYGAQITTTTRQSINGIGASGAWWVNDVALFPAEVRQNISELLLNQTWGTHGLNLHLSCLSCYDALHLIRLQALDSQTTAPTLAVVASALVHLTGLQRPLMSGMLYCSTQNSLSE